MEVILLSAGWVTYEQVDAIKLEMVAAIVKEWWA